MRFSVLLTAILGALAVLAQEPCNVSLTGTWMTCPGDDNATLTVVAGTPGLYTYDWSHSATVVSSTATGLAQGDYTVVVTDTSGCVSVLDTLITEPNVAPLGTLTYTDLSCAGANDASITLTLNPGGPFNYTWFDPPGAQTLTVANLGAGFYSVGISGPVGCPSYLGQEIGDPGITITGTTEFCPSEPPLLTAELLWGFEPESILWSTGDSTEVIQVVAGFSGDIDLVATNANGCVVNAQITLTELPSPTVAFVLADTTCVNVPVLAQTTLSTADSLVWRWPGGGFSNEFDPLMNFTQSGWMHVTLQGYEFMGCGSAPVLDSIYADPQVPAILTVMQIPCSPYVEIILGSNTDSCAFFIGDSLITNDCNGHIRYNMRRYAEYTYTLFATQPNGCNDTTAVVVDVRTEPTLFLANAFTPNGDDINELWPVRVDIADAGYELLVFDRWGAQVWGTKDPQEQWDGTSGGGPVPMGVYVYTMRMRDPCEPTNQVATKGHVTVFR